MYKHLKYKDKIIKSPDGQFCKVIDTPRVDFKYASIARKTAQTLVCRAHGGERLETKNAKDEIESVYLAKTGDAIFVNPHNPNDRYVPGNPDGSRWQFDDLTTCGYEVVGKDTKTGGVFVLSSKTFQFLHEVVKEPSCVEDAWGKGQHQFLFNGASLKLNGDGKVTGIDKDAFDSTWQILSAPSLKHKNPQRLPR